MVREAVPFVNVSVMDVRATLGWDSLATPPTVAGPPTTQAL